MCCVCCVGVFFFSSRRRHTRYWRDWSSDVCSSDLEEFFQIAPKPRSDVLNLLITGGSQGSRTLNQAARESWPLFRNAGFPRSEERRVGKECRCRWSPGRYKKRNRKADVEHVKCVAS